MMAHINPELKIFCENIKKLRTKNNLSKLSMARILGVTPWTVAKLERGILPDRLDCHVVFRIHQYFAIDLPDLFREMSDE